MRCVAAIVVLVALAAVAAGCGEGEAISEGATVSVYADATLCAGARQALAGRSGEAGDLRVRVVCAAPARGAARLDLATLGANARRATEDSTTVAYLQSPDPQATRFITPILEAADIGSTTNSSGRAAMRTVLEAIESADSGSLRNEVGEALEAD